MKELRGLAVGFVAAPVEDCFALLVAVDRYPAWFEVVREVDVLDSDEGGHPVRARARLHVSQSPVRKDFDLVVSVVTTGHAAVRVHRLPSDACDRDRLQLNWALASGGETRIDLEFQASVSVLPRLLPLGGVGNLIARTVLEAATAALAGP